MIKVKYCTGNFVTSSDNNFPKNRYSDGEDYEKEMDGSSFFFNVECQCLRFRDVCAINFHFKVNYTYVRLILRSFMEPTFSFLCE